MVIGRRFRRVVSYALSACTGALVIPSVHADTLDVPVKHAEQQSVRVIHFAAAQQSKNALVLVVYGFDDHMTQTALRAASEVRAAGYPLRGIIFGPRRDDARYVIEFYADTQLVSTFLNPTVGDSLSIAAEIRRGYSAIVAPRRRN